MICTLSELRNKEIVNVNTGTKIGYVDDVELNTDDATVMSMIVYGRPRFFGFFGRDEDVIIHCNEIRLIGEDAILVSINEETNYIKTKSLRLETLLK